MSSFDNVEEIRKHSLISTRKGWGQNKRTPTFLIFMCDSEKYFCKNNHPSLSLTFFFTATQISLYTFSDVPLYLVKEIPGSSTSS